MRTGLDRAKLFALVDGVGKAAEGPGRVYLVGGATALLLGFRDATIDVDLKLDPEPKAIFAALARLKETLDVNVELASPDLFLPELPGWRDRSAFIVRSGQVEFFHYDFYAQTLAKLLRGHAVDLADARAFLATGRVQPVRLLELFERIQGDLVRYPAIDAEEYERRVKAFAEGSQGG